MTSDRSAERTVLVFSIWASLGFLGVAGLVEGFSRDALTISLLGLAAVCAAFVAHMVVNAAFGGGFSRGEVALGIGAFGLFAALFVAAAATGGLSTADYLSGLAAFAAIGAGFLVYLSTRYGLRGAFSRFHHAGQRGNGGDRR